MFFLKTIEGNQNASSVATYHFKEPFVTKTVRIHPDDTSSACLRTEIYGCDPTPGNSVIIDVFS